MSASVATENSSAPVFVSGCPRSGTTLLGNLIDAHPNIAVFLESFFIPQYHLLQHLYRPLTNRDNLTRLANSISNQYSAKVNNLTFSDELLDELPTPTYPALIDAMMLQWAQERGAMRWGDKSPGYTSKFPLLQELFPDAKFIHIVRDGRDVWLSLQKLGWEKNVVRAARMWARTITAAQEFGRGAQAGHYMEVRYESLIVNPDATLDRIFEFIGEPPLNRDTENSEDQHRNEAFAPWPKVNKAVDAQNANKWMSKMSDRDIFLFESASKRTLRDNEYEVTEKKISAGGCHFSP